MTPVVIGNATLYLGDCLEVLPTLPKVDAMITDPPYPNNMGYFVDDIDTARNVVSRVPCVDAIVFWTETEIPPVQMPVVACHIWHRNNVNGRPYEPAWHFAADGKKRRSEVFFGWAIKEGIGPAAQEFEGHPTQKQVSMMRWCVEKTFGLVFDPFMGVGSTGVACAHLRRPFIGIERELRYFDIACRRIEDAQRQALLIPHEQPKQVQQELA